MVGMILSWVAGKVWDQVMDDSADSIKEGSLEDLRRLKRVVEALTQDNQTLILSFQRQQDQIVSLQKWLATAFFFLTLSISAIAWLIFYR